MLKSFSLNFKQLICLIEKFSLSLRSYIDNSYLIYNKRDKSYDKGRDRKRGCKGNRY